MLRRWKEDVLEIRFMCVLKELIKVNTQVMTDVLIWQNITENISYIFGYAPSAQLLII